MERGNGGGGEEGWYSYGWWCKGVVNPPTLPLPPRLKQFGKRAEVVDWGSESGIAGIEWRGKG